jgi:SAM-dependent methyltransferase
MDLSETSNNPNRHPWELSRAGFILDFLKGKESFLDSARILDIGAGDLFFASEASRRFRVQVDAVDTAFQDHVTPPPGIERFRDLDSIPDRKYRVICALDVLEHVADDETLLNRLISLLEPGGLLLITVPAFQMLYTYHDLKLKHFRRYHKDHLLYLIRDPGSVQVEEAFYFFHLLFFVRLFQKVVEFFLGIKPKTPGIHSVSEWPHPENHLITRGLKRVLKTDARLTRTLARLGLRLPGLSLCVALRKVA